MEQRQGRVALLPYCEFTLKAEKPTNYPKQLRSVGDHLKKRRLDLGLRQKDVAAQMKVSEATVRGWENDKSSPSVRYIPRIIAFLGYDPYPKPQSLGEEIAAARRRLGLSRKRLAKELEIDEMTLAQWESCTRFPKKRHEQIIRQFLASVYIQPRRSVKRW